MVLAAPSLRQSDYTVQHPKRQSFLIIALIKITLFVREET
jgi:hypothetical protein